MKNLNLLILLLSVGMVVGCAKESKSGDSVPYANVPPGGMPYVPPIVGPGQAPGTTYGGSAPLSISSLSTMSQYTGRPMNSPQNVRINLNMLKDGSTYSGTATVTYTDNGWAYEGYFTTGSSSEATKYNIVFVSGGEKVWHAVFEDFMGGFVVVIDGVVDLGDGQGAQDSVNGSVWFKNFGLTYAPHPPTYCWFVYKGPYDCRPWPDGNGMNTAQSPNPGAGYVRLGNFSGMSLRAAFNNEKVF
jgi:hypothetical protein